MGIDLASLGERLPEEYSFNAQSLSEAFEQMRRKGPEGRFGKCTIDVKFQSFRTSVEVTEYDSRSYSALATLSQGTIKVEIIYRVPHWRNIELLPSPIQTEWIRFMRCLWVHERGHPAVEIPIIEEYKWKFEELRGVGTGGSAQAAANEANRDIENKWKGLIGEIENRREEARNRYDLETNHGGTQGVYLNLEIDRELQGSSRH